MSASPAHTKIGVVRRETLQKYEVSYKNATERGDLIGKLNKKVILLQITNKYL